MFGLSCRSSEVLRTELCADGRRLRFRGNSSCIEFSESEQLSLGSDGWFLVERLSGARSSLASSPSCSDAISGQDSERDDDEYLLLSADLKETK